MNKIPASIPILTLNARQGLERLLPLIVPYVDDVFIMDGNSTDGTPELARSFGLRVEKQFDTDEPNQRITHFTEMRLRLWSKARQRWLLIMDSDEEPGPGVLDLLRAVVAENDILSIHRLQRLAKLLDGRLVQQAFFYPEYYPRIFNLDSGISLRPRAVHEKLIIPEQARLVDHAQAIIHPWPSVQDFWRKQRYYVSLEYQAFSPTWKFLWHTVVRYNVRSFVGQLFRSTRAWIRGTLRHEVVLPWGYTWVLLWYRWALIGRGTRQWLRFRRRA